MPDMIFKKKHFLNLYLVQRFDIKNKYPKFSRIIGYFENSALLFILVECIFCVICLLIILISALYIIKKSII